MFAKFNFIPSNAFYNNELNPCLTLGNQMYSEHQKEVQDCLSEYITEEGIINGSALKEHWFSISQKDIFISHSHKDIHKVKAFAGWLKLNFGLEAFIDSCSWGYCDVLLNKIDKKYCYKPKTKTYDYNLRNYTTSHVHMMLSTALTEMINKTECIIFFNTPNSIIMADELDKISKKEKTISPWIYHELSISTMIQISPPQRRSFLQERYDQGASFAHSDLKIGYDVSGPIKSMINLSDDTLKKWKEEHDNKKHALDELYKILGI